MHHYIYTMMTHILTPPPLDYLHIYYAVVIAISKLFQLFVFVILLQHYTSNLQIITVISPLCCLCILGTMMFRSNNLMMVFNFTIFYGILLIKKYWVDSNIWPVAKLQII